MTVAEMADDNGMADARSSTCLEGVAMMTCFALESIFASAVVGVASSSSAAAAAITLSDPFGCFAGDENSSTGHFRSHPVDALNLALCLGKAHPPLCVAVELWCSCSLAVIWLLNYGVSVVWLHCGSSFEWLSSCAILARNLLTLKH